MIRILCNCVECSKRPEECRVIINTSETGRVAVAKDDDPPAASEVEKEKDLR